MFKKLLPYLFLFLIGLIYPKSILAQNFTFDYDVTYEVSENASTQVNYNVVLTNKQTEFYAQNYVLIISSENLTDITATDIFGTLTPQISKENGQTRIQVEFPTPVVGIGQKLPFTIKFKTKDLTQKKGRIWEILIPGTEISSETQSYDIRLLVPNSFGQAAYSTPASSTFGSWSLDEHQGRGINVAYGDFQAFDLRLKYFLENTNNFPVLKEITIPPDTVYQKVVIKRLSQIPQNVITDTDGNYLAQYVLQPHETKDIELEAQTLVYMFPQKQSILNAALAERLTQSRNFWNLSSDNSQIADQLNSTKDIYDFTVKNLIYDYEQVTQKTVRQGADGAITSKDNAVCLEFSDLFIALARAKKIPARAIHGYAYTTNSRIQPLSLTADILHAWAEYYDNEKQTWVQVDPTWGNTTKGVDYFSKFDFNHIAFAILGNESDYPYPAGAFRDEEDTKTVFVDFSQDLFSPSESLEIEATIPKFYSLDQVLAYIEIKNTGNVAQTVKTLQLTSPNNETVSLNITIPPYGQLRYPFRLSAPLILTPTEEQISFTVNGESFTKNYQILPIYLKSELIAGTVIILGLISLLFIKSGIKRT